MQPRSAWSRNRIAPLRDGGKFRLEADASGLTDGGTVWIRWAKVGADAGWYALGTEQMPLLDPPLASPSEAFWSRVYVMASEVGNGNLDAVHCLGPEVLSVGGLALTLSSGYAQGLIAECFERYPLVWLAAMAPALGASGPWFFGATGPHGREIVDQDGPCRDLGRLERLVRGGPNWSTTNKRRARAWVLSVSTLLGCRASDMASVQLDYCSQYVPGMLPERIAERIAWPRSGPRDGWMFSVEQRAVWALSMTLAIESEEQSERLLEATVSVVPRDAREALRRMLTAVDDDGYTETFRRRVKKTVKRSQQLFGFGI